VRPGTLRARAPWLAASLLLAAPAHAATEAADTFLGLPTVIWKTANLVAFIGVLIYLLAKPMRAFFHSRRDAIGRDLEDAARARRDADEMRADVERRIASLSSEIQALQERMRREGERERDALARQGEEEAARLLAQVEQQAARRSEEARVALAREAASVAAGLAWELLQKEVTPADRERIFRETLARLQPPAGGRGGA
jgi:F0F1-type ATP synthase membrane subunit b/b'